MFDEFSQGMFLLFVFQVWDRCFQLIGPLVDLLHFIFEIADMSIPRVFGHSIALSPRCVPPHHTRNSSEFLRREPSLQGGNGAGIRVYLETNTLFLVRLVHQWTSSLRSEAPDVYLCAHEELIRQFLLGTSPLPDDVALTVFVCPNGSVLNAMLVPWEAHLPECSRYFFTFQDWVSCFTLLTSCRKTLGKCAPIILPTGSS